MTGLEVATLVAIVTVVVCLVAACLWTMLEARGKL
jgi:hypothetical protein